MLGQIDKIGTSLFSDNSSDLAPGESKTLDLTAPTDGRPFFWGFEIPDKKKVFFIGMDVAGTATLKLRFYNSEPMDKVTVKVFIRQ